jgi:hypothetical protein
VLLLQALFFISLFLFYSCFYVCLMSFDILLVHRVSVIGIFCDINIFHLKKKYVPTIIQSSE